MAEQYFCNFSAINEHEAEEKAGLCTAPLKTFGGYGQLVSVRVSTIDQLRVPALQLCVI